MSFKSWGPACERCIYGVPAKATADGGFLIRCRAKSDFSSWHEPFDFCGEGYFLVSDPVESYPPPYSVWTFWDAIFSSKERRK